jgi:hypothetical protein
MSNMSHLAKADAVDICLHIGIMSNMPLLVIHI